ncbi:MAG: type I DNA topoisomerase [Legionellaceae bacterium]|nr:type I DNA topoisomerase [Legionellaceae bacterium]
MSSKVVVVESPAKAKTIQKYLGPDYTVLASYGHVRDLPARKGSVLPEQEFSMIYAPIEKNKRHIDAIAKALSKADALFLATDPDREGEAISWHVFALMQERKLLKNKPVQRIVFHEITKTAILEAMQHPRDVAMNLVNAQQARRALDYLVGFNLSPLLWKKVQRGLSAGRVQSPALRLIVDREEEIERFISQEYWQIKAHLQHNSPPFVARLTHIDDQKLEQFSVTTAERAAEIQAQVLALAEGKLIVKNVEKKQRKRKPAAPFITSTLQQEAARKLGFTARKTMMLAQNLYEGIDVGAGQVGLISYMRTDSVHLAKEAIQEIREWITQQYGDSFAPTDPSEFKTKSKNAQEAHEAIRPTEIKRTPDSIKDALTLDQWKLYQLIWKRTVASQMSDALMDTVAVDFNAKKRFIFRANGSVIAFPGFLSVYEEGQDDTKSEEDAMLLPALQVGDEPCVNQIETSQHFTEPPPRYSEATLVKALEEYDIGRPSTYASIIHTLQQRNYVIADKKRFSPTDIGRIVSKFLTDYFTRYVDYQFTAQLEDTLDEISRGEREWVPVLHDFWGPFEQQIQEIDEQVRRKDVTTETLDSLCPTCGKQLTIRLGKRGRFIGCSGYPECNYTQDLGGDTSEAPTEPEVVADRECPSCQSPLHIKKGRYGLFIGCSKYPECKHMESLKKPVDTEVPCPKCRQSTLVERRSRRGKVFFSCNRYPQCDYAVWNNPIATPCPKCQWPLLTLKESKRLGTHLACPEASCDYTAPEPVEE